MEPLAFVWRGDYFVTRRTFEVDLIYSLSKRKYVTPISIESNKIEYRLLPGRYIHVWSYTVDHYPQSFKAETLIRAELADVRGSSDSINLQKETIASAKVNVSDAHCVKAVISSPLIPQQIKDFIRMAMRRPIDRSIFKKIYSEQEHSEFIKFVLAKTYFDPAKIESRTA
jgi:hypothetical protein